MPSTIMFRNACNVNKARHECGLYLQISGRGGDFLGPQKLYDKGLRFKKNIYFKGVYKFCCNYFVNRIAKVLYFCDNKHPNQKSLKRKIICI